MSVAIARRGTIASSKVSAVVPQYIGSGAVTAIPISTPTAIPKPAGTQVGDLMILAVADAYTDPPDTAAPAGWTLVGNDISGASDSSMSVFKRIMQAGDGNPTVQGTSMGVRAAVISVWRGYSTVIKAGNDTRTSATGSFATMSPTPTENDNDTIFQIWTADTAAGRTGTPAASWTEIIDSQPNSLHVYGQYQQFASPVVNTDVPDFSTSDYNTGIALVITNNSQISGTVTAPSLVGTSQASTGGTATTTLPITIPAGVVAGDLLVLNVGKDITTAAVNAISGWTATPERAVSTITEHTTFYRVAQAGDAGSTVNVTMSAATVFDLAMAAYHPASAPTVISTPIDLTSNDTDFSIHLGTTTMAHSGFVVLVSGINNYATTLTVTEPGFRTDLDYSALERTVIAVKGYGPGRPGYQQVQAGAATHGGTVALVVEGTT